VIPGLLAIYRKNGSYDRDRYGGTQMPLMGSMYGLGKDGTSG
jgi:hypothetical protein